MAARNFVTLGYQLIRHVVPAIVRPARTLWHEVIGFFFLVLAVWPIPSGIRTYQEFGEGKEGSLVRLLVTLVFVTIMAGFGISSFRRARKISRSQI